MFNDTDLPKSAVESPDTRFDAGGERQAATPPVRFGRLALCVATASALAVGVVGTVAYGVWFNHDQQRYADAIAGARQALGTAAPKVAGQVGAESIAPPARTTASMQATAAAPATEEAGEKQASWFGPVTRPPAPVLSQTVVADPDQGASSVPAVLHAASPSNPGAQPLGGGRSGKGAHLAQPDRRAASTVNTRHKSSLFARMGSFFRRVSYRQHGTGSQQDLYSHP
ncbi:hypothetical protein [Paraburkholderia fungorum]|uniref:Uncharacterized protein n=1 Tax=Paraburkholderia fungorum TaxID=134537 RepID=A0A420GYG5_9BURK|nr:hypothetical protein [Paraburkholderia fungorum]RKF50212.1 hypothetical protein BCY88_15795 [Paraburkholderia fungorum]